jgi:choline dehydrogenase-like flavoprotein
MATSQSAQNTDFTRDVMGRYTCNGFDEAMQSIDRNARSDARPFDFIVIGGGSFGAALAQHLLYNDKSHRHRIVVLEAGHFLLPEHVQNLPMLGLGIPASSTTDQGVRNEVWRLPWQGQNNVGFPGLAYCLGGRSLYFGGWSPQLLEDETITWSAVVNNDLRKPNGYFRQAGEQIGTNSTNDYIHGAMHAALRQLLFDGINAGQVPDAIPLAQLPLTLDDVPAGQENLYKLEAPLAVQARPPRSGFFPFNKFSSVPLLIKASRAAQSAAQAHRPSPNDARADAVKKRLMVVPNVHITRLITTQEAGTWRVTAIETNLGIAPVPANGKVIIALGTIESARLALTSFPNLPNTSRIGANLMAHLRSNLTVRVPRASLPAGLPSELQASALFVKCRLEQNGQTNGYFHQQITAAGLNKPSTDSEAELFKKVPSMDFYAPFLTATDDTVVITIRSIGEMEPQNPNSRVTLSNSLDDFNYPRASVGIVPTAKDNLLWNAMDKCADDLAKVFANNQPYEVLTPDGYKPVGANQSISDVWTFNRRDGLGTTHHESGTLAMGDDATKFVTNSDGRFHHVTNSYAAGPAMFPTIGSPNPMLTGISLVRRLGDHLTPKPSPFTPEAGFTALFDGISTDKWRMSTIKNQPPGRDYPGNFALVDGTLESTPGNDLGLYWCTEPMPPNFVLRLQWLRWNHADNSGVFVRFPHPNSKGYDNTAYVGVDFGFEIQIDELGAPGGADKHKTGAVYNEDNQILTLQAAKPAGEWNDFEIRVEGQIYTVLLNGQQVAHFTNTNPNRGLPSAPNAPSFIGLQSHFGSRVAFRHIRYQPLP